MAKKIVHYGDPLLRKKARPVPEITPDIQTLIDEMVDSMRAASGVGLAAPQIGVSLRVIVWDVGEGVGALVNPKIIRASGMQDGPEGCLSIPGLSGSVERPERVTIRGIDRTGKEVRITGEGLAARCFCHEVDHLDGILFVDLADESTLHVVTPTEEDDVEEELTDREAEAPEQEIRSRVRAHRRR